MAASPRFEIYDPSGEYIAVCKYPEHAAMLISGLGDGATIRSRHRTIVWTEIPAGESYDIAGDGATIQSKHRTIVWTEIPAGESYDIVAETVYDREGRPYR